MNSTPKPETTGIPPNREQVENEFWRLCEVIAHLRSPEGCPWDRVQTLETIKPFTLEETYELLEAIDSGDDTAIVEELGDLLLQVMLDSQIGADEGRFSIVDVVRVITDKMIRRHPHVFGSEDVEDAEAVKVTWERIKQAEGKPKKESKLDGLPKDLPALMAAARLQEKAAKVGYDFPHRDMLFAKLDEELNELREELYGDTNPEVTEIAIEATHTPDEKMDDEDRRQRAEDELGDVLFVLANIARRWKLNPEEALRRTNAKFKRRFRAIEQGLARIDKTVDDATLIEMEEQYQAEKMREKQQDMQK